MDAANYNVYGYTNGNPVSFFDPDGHAMSDVLLEVGWEEASHYTDPAVRQEVVDIFSPSPAAKERNKKRKKTKSSKNAKKQRSQMTSQIKVIGSVALGIIKQQVFRGDLATGLSFIPGVGEGMDVYTIITGEEITGEYVGRMWGVAGFIIPQVSGAALKAIAEKGWRLVKGKPKQGKATGGSWADAGKVTIDSLRTNAKAFTGKSADEIADMLRKEGYEITVKDSKRSRSGAKIIQINNTGDGKNITQVQVSPGGGRHGGLSYVKISTNDQGIIKIVDGPESLYKTNGSENATIIFEGGK